MKRLIFHCFLIVVLSIPSDLLGQRLNRQEIYATIQTMSSFSNYHGNFFISGIPTNKYTNKIEVKQKEYEAYGLATDYSEELLNNGLANYLEVLTARENALNSRLDLSNAKYNQLKAVVDLYEALGGGWQ